MVIMLWVVMVVEVLDMVLVITGYDAVVIVLVGVAVGVAASEVYMVDAGCGNCLEIATKKMAGPRDRSTVLAYGTLFCHSRTITRLEIILVRFMFCALATTLLRNCDRAVGNPYRYMGDTVLVGGGYL